MYNVFSSLYNGYSHLCTDDAILCCIKNSPETAIKNWHVSFSILQTAFNNLKLTLNAQN